MYSLTLILVVLSAESVDTIYGGCVSLSLLVHYFTLAAVMWMGAEALITHVSEIGHRLRPNYNEIYCSCFNNLLV